MEEFVEDYTQYVKKKPIDTKTQANNATQNLTILEFQRKKELEARVLKIVNFLIEGKLSPPVFLRCLKHINRSYYEDIVEERALTKLCGYALCGNQIRDMPRNQYSIDLKNKKVYDMAERKKFCSINCYTANLHIKNQIDNSPLWSRNFEDCPKYTLKTTVENNIYGQEANLRDEKRSEKSAFVSVFSFTELSLSDMEDSKSLPQCSNNANKNKVDTMLTIGEDEEINETVIEAINPTDNVLKNDTKSVEKKEKSKRSKAKRKTPEEILNAIRKSVYEWITIETFIFLYGDTTVREVINKKQLQEQIKFAKVEDVDVDFKQKYFEICRKLHLNELDDEKYDNSIVGNENLQPLPDYKSLKAETKELKLKVRSFYDGTGHEVIKNDVTSNNINEENLEAGSSHIPALEPSSVNTIRLKIYLTSINKSMVTVTQNLRISSNMLENLHLLIKTFKFDAHNVTFKPAAWTIITVILLELLAVKDSKLKEELHCKKSKNYMSLIFKCIPHAETFLSDLLLKITDINWFLKYYLSLNTTKDN